MRVAQIMAGQEAGGAELFYARLTSALAEDTDVKQIAILRPHTRWLEMLESTGVALETHRFGGRLDLRPSVVCARIWSHLRWTWR